MGVDVLADFHNFLFSSFSEIWTKQNVYEFNK